MKPREEGTHRAVMSWARCGTNLEQKLVELARGCHYAVRGLIFLGDRAEPGEPVLLRDIAASIEAPEAFLSKIFQSLRASGIVRSHRGTTRGYGLARDPVNISLYDIIAATEGPASLHASGIVVEEAGGPFARVISDVEELVANRLRSTTLKDLVELSHSSATSQAQPT